MKEIVLGQGANAAVYAVPDPIAENLWEHCHAYTRSCGGEGMTPTGFLSYVKTLFPDENAGKIKEIAEDTAAVYASLPQFWFSL